MSSLSRREFLQMLAAASAAGMGLGCSGAGAGRSTAPGNLYEVAPFGIKIVVVSPGFFGVSASPRNAPHFWQ